MDPIVIGNFISEMRKKNNMTQADLAGMLNVTSQAISKWENGRGIPDIEMLKKLSEIFLVDIDDILNGEKKQVKKKYIYIYGIVLLVFTLVLVLVWLGNRADSDSFKFSSIATDNDSFIVKGIIAYDKSKKSIYISDVIYDGKDQAEYQGIECILYEVVSNSEKKIDQWGEINSGKNKGYLLTELLKGIEFNVDNYECDCEEYCNNLYLRINALSLDDKVITYNIPIQLEQNCSK